MKCLYTFEFCKADINDDYSFPNRFMNMGPKSQFLIKCDTQIFELFHFLNGFIFYVYILMATLPF